MRTLITLFVMIVALWMLKLFGVVALPWWVVLTATGLYVLIVLVALLTIYFMYQGFLRLISPRF